MSGRFDLEVDGARGETPKKLWQADGVLSGREAHQLQWSPNGKTIAVCDSNTIEFVSAASGKGTCARLVLWWIHCWFEAVCCVSACLPVCCASLKLRCCVLPTCLLLCKYPSVLTASVHGAVVGAVRAPHKPLVHAGRGDPSMASMSWLADSSGVVTGGTDKLLKVWRNPN